MHALNRLSRFYLVNISFRLTALGLPAFYGKIGFHTFKSVSLLNGRNIKLILKNNVCRFLWVFPLFYLYV